MLLVLVGEPNVGRSTPFVNLAGRLLRLKWWSKHQWQIEDEQEEIINELI